MDSITSTYDDSEHEHAVLASLCGAEGARWEVLKDRRNYSTLKHGKLDEIYYCRMNGSSNPLCFIIFDYGRYSHTCPNDDRVTSVVPPLVTIMMRVAGQDDILPLAFLIRTKFGEMISQIPVRKGQTVYISVAAYNRLEAVWGANVHEFHPERFLEVDKTKQTSVGVYANLLNFSGGIRSCIAWRFSVIEIQAIVATLLENFVFMPEGEQKTVMRKPCGLILPLIEGYHGSWMGLQVHGVQ